MKKIFLSILSGLVFGCLVYGPGYAQKPSVAVDNFSGNLSASIPLYNYRFGSISVPVILTYNGGGVRVKEAEGSGGVGWNLVAGGAVSRQLRGLPDDVLKENGTSNERKGWLYNTNGTKINNFTVANDNNLSTTADEFSDFSYIINNFIDLSDTEPDIFYVNAPGLSCKLMFDNDHNIRTIPYQDIKVSYQFETSVSPSWSSYGRIKSFTITTAEGLTYVFDALELATKFTSSSNPTAIKYFRKEYEQYKSGIEYVNAWKLTHIYDLSGKSVDFFYEEKQNTTSVDRTALKKGEGTTVDYSFTTTTWIEQTRLALISRPELPIEAGLKFEYFNAPTSGVSMVAAIRAPERIIGFRYKWAKVKNNDGQYKSFLTSVGEADSATAANQFAGVRNPVQFNYQGLVDNNIALPDSNSKAIDRWGYYNESLATTLLPNVYINPSTSGYERFRNVAPGAASASYIYAITDGADRDVNPLTIANGSLNVISYPEGGSTTVIYEPKDYYDQTRGSTTIGGGLRVKEIKDFDGANVAGTISRNYSYLNPATGLSSGKAISVPLLSFITPYVTTGTTENQWKNSVVRLEENLSQEDNAVIYSHVKVSQNGAGGTLFEYTTPATYFETSAAPDWTPTTVNISRASSATPGYLSNDVNTYPFIPNPNFDFERGLLSKVTQFNEGGDKVSESAYSYQRSNAPVVITGLKYENNIDVLAYGKYAIYANVGKLTEQVVNKLYDAPSTTRYNQTSTLYAYNGTNHKLPTLVQQTNSDGSISRKYTKYTKDYDASVHSDNQANAIYNLQGLGCNFPIESYTQLERNSANKTIGASLVKFKPFDINGQSRDYPSQNLAFLSQAGVTDFAVSTINGGAFVNDSRYIVKQNIQAYDPHGFPFTVDDNNRHVQTTIINHEVSGPIATFDNAAIEEVAYSNFDLRELNDPSVAFGFIINGSGLYSTTSRSKGLSYAATTANYFTREIKKSSTRKNYVFSIWLNASAAGNLTLTLTGGSTLSYTMPFANTSGEWKYYEMKVPVVAMSNTFTAKFQSDANVLIDDALFYPSDAVASTAGYDSNRLLKTVETNTNGVSQYYEYDKQSRIRHVLDQDKNILVKKTYVNTSDQSTYNSSSLSPITGEVGQPVNFSDNAIQVDPENSIVWTWNFGDGSAPVSSTQLGGFTTHVYAATGTYTITLTKTSSIYGTKVVTGTATIGANTSPATIYGSGPMTLTFTPAGGSGIAFSGSTLWNGASLGPGTYTVEIYTTDDPYDVNTTPSGFKKYTYALINANGQGYQYENCRVSRRKEHSTSFSITILAGRIYSFGTSTSECELSGEEL